MVLNYLHVSNIFNSGLFVFNSHYKNAVSLWKGPRPLACHFPGVLYHLTGFFGLQKILSRHASRL